MASFENIVQQVLGIEQIGDELAYGSVPQWDSLNHVNLMVALEQAYGVTIDEDRMVELTTIGAIRSFVNGLKQEPQ